MMTDKIFLIGFMGSGKSTHGKKLAKLLNKPFIDLDNYIEKKEELSVEEIFEKKGEDYFREKESEYLKQVIARYPQSVVSLGGGTPCFNNNITQILKAGTAVYIEMPADSLHYRLTQSENKRPLLKDKSLEEGLEFIKDLLRRREPFYLQAQLTINGINLTADKLKEALSLYSASH
jgi:shikimate kinase